MKEKNKAKDDQFQVYVHKHLYMRKYQEEINICM